MENFLKAYEYLNSNCAEIGKLFVYSLIVASIIRWPLFRKNSTIFKISLIFAGLVPWLLDSYVFKSTAPINLLYIYWLWYLGVYILTFIPSPSFRIITLSIAYILSIVFRHKLGFFPAWNGWIELAVFQMQFLRSLDICLTPLNTISPGKRSLFLMSYISVPTNFLGWYVIRFDSWIDFLKSDYKEKVMGVSAELPRRILNAVFGFIVLYVWVLWRKDPWVTGFYGYFCDLIFFCLGFWPLFNNLSYISALLMGIPTQELCRYPILVKSPIEYWQRMQLAIAAFIRDRIFFNRWGGKTIPRYRNLAFAMIFIGLWHSLVIPYLVWGIVWAILLCGNHYYRQKLRRYILPHFKNHLWLYNILAWLITWHLLVTPYIVNLLKG